MLDLDSINQSITATVPVHRHIAIINKKKYFIGGLEDGWYDITVQGNSLLNSTIAYPLDKINAQGYSVDGWFIPNNFDTFYRRYGRITTKILFPHTNNRAVSVGVYYGKTYYIDLNYADTKFDLVLSGDITEGITPEIKYALSLYSLQQERERIAQEKKASRNIHTVIGDMFQRSSAQILDITINGNRAIVTWTIKYCSYTFNSVINTNTLMVIEAGYCMSGDDRRHNITSLIKTAEEYDERDLIYITRR